jgi:thiol-disulfide isomerase/thioredoxin
VLIGAFTLAVAVLAMLFALWAAKTVSDRQWDEYEVVFTEAVTGLTRGGVVQYNGIAVGDVTELKLDAADPSKVVARIRVGGGTPVTVDPSKGPVMLVFLAHWCPHCNREIPELLAWRDAGGVPDGLQVIAVTTAVAPDRENYPPSEWIPNMGWTWPVLADSQDNEAAIAFGVSGFPFSVIIGTDGTVLGRASGELGQDGIQAFVDGALG